MNRFAERLASAWKRTDRIFDTLAPGAIRERPIDLRHPFLFYLGHLPAFAWNQVARGVLGLGPLHPDFEDLFARGIDPVGPASGGPPPEIRWPDEAEVRRYRDRVRSAILPLSDQVLGLDSEDALVEKGRVLSLVLEHELMHQETLLYMVARLPLEKVRDGASITADGPAMETGTRVRPGARVAVEAGPARLGARFESVPFGWDNEFPEHRVHVPAFEIDALPVTNGDFLEFVESGGYERRDLWDAGAWAWKAARGIGHPSFWKTSGTGRAVRFPFEELPLEAVLDHPVYVSHAEAAAYARAKGRSLPTEAEFHRAAYGDEERGAAGAPATGTGARDLVGNFGLQRTRTVAAGSAGKPGPTGCADLLGNGWEWTSTLFAPFPGFRAWIRTYPGYSSDFFDGLHYVLCGASFVTDAALVRRSFRNWFQPHYPYVFAKFRLVSR